VEAVKPKLNSPQAGGEDKPDAWIGDFERRLKDPGRNRPI
jgi:hypothetical protein